MAKKKKTQLKPVARGFATTSVPKKPVVIDEPPIAQDIPVPEEDSPSNINGNGDAMSKTPGADPNGMEFDLAKAEEQSLQNIIDKYQEKTEKEITRTIKVGEYSLRGMFIYSHILS